MKYKKMDRKIKRKWLKALRSGKYKQGRSALRSVDDKFCCLGVLCDVMAPEKWTPPASREGFTFAMVSDAIFPPHGIRQDAGLNALAVDHLVDMNDEKRNRFSTIAKWIEENL